MSRKIKIFGVLTAVFALTAVSVSSAFATERYFHSESTSTTFSGTQTTGHVFTTNAGKVTCTTAKFTGSASVATTMELTIEPEYKSCTAFGFIGVPIDVNGCHYLFTSETATKGTTEPVITHITCPTGKAIEVTAPGCTTKVGPQTIGGNSFDNGTSGGKKDVTVTTNVEGIEYNECGTVRNNGKYTGTTTVTGKNSEGAATGVWYE
jgi:hypothetical protein